MKEDYRFILSGGGTGGHIYPAIAIANELKQQFPNAQFLFVGAEDRMEMDKVPAAGYAIKGLWISGIARKIISKNNFLFPFKLLSSLWKANRILREFNPDVVIGTGGFASGPLLQVATMNKVPTVVQEQNSYPGITNKLLSKKAQIICVAYDGLERFFPKDKLIKTGNPVRQDLLQIKSKRAEASSVFKLDKQKITVLILGGSLGAGRINKLIENNLAFFEAQNIQLIWQCGSHYEEAYKKYNEKDFVQVHAYLNKMDLAYAASDMIISRSGASSVSELCVVGKPVLFIPSPNVTENHQSKNAAAIVEKNAAIMIEEKNLDEEFIPKITQVLSDKELQQHLANNIANLAKVNATKDIVKEVIKLIERK